MSELSTPTALYRFICFRIPDTVKGLVKMRASQIEAFLHTELTQGSDTSLALALGACRACLEVGHWLSDSSKHFE